MSYDISALGNALVDTQFMVDYEFLQEFNLEANSMVLVSAKDQEPILKKLKALNSESVSDCGGSATNSLVAASNYGSKCHHVCRVADDDDGNMYINSLKKAGVHHIGISKDNPGLPTGKCLILVTPDAKRTMISMLGVSEFLGENDIDLTAKRIVWGKYLNTGQTCVAPDYILVEKNVKKKLINRIINYIEEFYGKDPAVSEFYGKIINKGR